ncbi:MAG: hypothetical protein JXA33_16325 [Anaerolineae bacterium]|nr:hypothetical protein [Anaerolineae bacterium]
MSRPVSVNIVKDGNISSLDEVMRLLSEKQQPVFIETQIEGRLTQGVLINYQTYQKFLQSLEDLEDIRVMRETEAEYRANGGQDFFEVIAELEAEGESKS